MLKCTSNTWEKTNSNGFCFSRTLSFFTSFLLSWTNQTFQTCQSIRAIFISHHPPQCFLFWENVRWYIVIITCVLLRSLHKDTTQRSMENYPGWSTETLELVNLGHAFLNAEQYKYIQMIQILINITKCTYIYIYIVININILYIFIRFFKVTSFAPMTSLRAETVTSIWGPSKWSLANLRWQKSQKKRSNISYNS